MATPCSNGRFSSSGNIGLLYHQNIKNIYFATSLGFHINKLFVPLKENFENEVPYHRLIKILVYMFAKNVFDFILFWDV